MPFWESLKLGQSIFSQLHPSRPTWDASQLPDLDGFNLVVTGGTSGIGLACARALVDKGGRVLILGRDPEKGKKVVEGMVGTGKVEFVEADLGDLESVRKAAEEIKKRVDHIDVLFVRVPLFQTLTQGADERLLAFVTEQRRHHAVVGRLLLDSRDRTSLCDQLPRSLPPHQTPSASTQSVASRHVPSSRQH